MNEDYRLNSNWWWENASPTERFTYELNSRRAISEHHVKQMYALQSASTGSSLVDAIIGFLR